MKKKFILSQLVIVFFFVFLIFGFHYGFYLLLVNNDSFSLKKVIVNGNRFVSSDEIILKGGLSTRENIINIDLTTIKNRLEKHSLIESVEVKRVFPDKIEINIKEKDIVANLLYNNTYYVIDKNGYFLTNGIFVLAPYLELDYIPIIENGKIKDDFITYNLNNIFEYKKLDKIEKITIRKDIGIIFFLKKPKNVAFFVGKKIVDDKILDRIFFLSDYLINNNLSINFVDLRKENAIGISNN